VEWDEARGQFYCEYVDGGEQYRMWLEELESLNLKSSLALKYGLAGVCCWSREYAADSVWGLLARNTEAIATYQQWQREAAGAGAPTFEPLA